MNIPIITIVGRPKVGKSTLFNRIDGRRISIVSDIPGTTRDRVSFNSEWNDNKFCIIDTAGLNDKSHEDKILKEVKFQFSEALNNSNLILFIVNVNEGLTQEDNEIARIIRKSGKPILLVVNKVDSNEKESGIMEFYSLGMGDPLPISAYHNIGMTDLIEKCISIIPKFKNDNDQNQLRVSIVGRPNVGKSSIFNSITNSKRSIVSTIPGTTRDSIDSYLNFKGKDILFIDTAGLRRRGKTEKGLEKFSILRTINSIERSHISILVLDTSELITDQDTHIGGFIEQAERGYIIVINKWDLSKNLDINTNTITERIFDRFKFMRGAPIIFTSANTGYGIDYIAPTIMKVWSEFSKKINDDDLNSELVKCISKNPIPRSGNQKPKIYKITQVRTAPPTFSVESRQPKLIHFSYRRYLENHFRNEFGFDGTPVVMNFNSKIK